jgi:cell division protein ZapA
MGQITIKVAERDYTLACRDGEEARLTALSQYLDKRAQELTRALGQLSEPRALLMTALLTADELFDIRDGKRAVASPDQDKALKQISDIQAHIERLSASLEG